MEDVWIQIKDSCEKLKKETNAKNGHIRKMLKEISDRYYSSNSDQLNSLLKISNRQRIKVKVAILSFF